MADFGLGKDGFKRKTLADIREEMREGALKIFGEGVNLSDDSIIGQFIDLFAIQADQVWQGLEGNAQSFTALGAEGIAADNNAALFDVFREDAKPTRGKLTINGTPGTLVPSGYTIRASTIDENAVTTADVIIQSNGSVEAQAELLNAGVIPVMAGQIDSVVDFVGGVDSVTNASDWTLGSPRETDEELEIRRRASLSQGGTTLDRATRGDLLALDFIDQALVISNRSDSISPEGFPPHSVNAILWPETVDPNEVAQILTIMVLATAGGVQAAGDQVYTLTDAFGYTDQYGFTFANPLATFARIEITKGTLYPTDGDQRVRQSVEEYSQNLSVGEDISRFQLACRLAAIPGVIDAEVFLLVGSPPSSLDNVDIIVPQTGIGQIVDIVVNS